MLSTTASSISNSNSIISDSVSSFNNPIIDHQNVNIKKQRRRGLAKDGSIDSATISYSTNGYLERAKRFNELNNSDLNQQKHRKQKELNVNRNNYRNNLPDMSKQYQNKQNSKMSRRGINDSSDLSSNNLTLSELESNNSSNRNFSNIRLQRKRLIKCILREDIDLLKTMLGKSDLIKIRDKHRNTLMHIACGFGRLKSVQTLFKLSPALVDQIDDKGHNPIDIAIKHGQLDVVKWLINKTNRLLVDSQPNKSNIYQRSCLHLASKHGECEILRFILGEMYKQQLLLDIQDTNGNTAAHLAAKYNHLDCLQALVEYNCDVTIVNKNSHTPCFVAEYYGNQECVHYLMIVETCINLSIKVVKIGRKLRETRNNNEILKAQMDEAIAINNDFINQRENVMNISLNLMQRQINDLENKIINEIEQLESEKKILTERVETLSKSKSNTNLNMFIDNKNRQENGVFNRKNINDFILNHNNKLKNFKSLSSLNHNSNENIIYDKNNLYKRNSNYNFQNLENDLNLCKQELINTNQNCHKILKLDQKRLESVKSRFDEIKANMEASSNSSNDFDLFKTNINNNNADKLSDLLNSKEHLDVLKKMYQDATHKLMIFRNALKERQLNKTKIEDVQKQQQQQQQNKLINKNDYNRSSSSSSSASSSSTCSPSLVNNINSNNINKGIRNNYQFVNNRNLDKVNEDDEYVYKESNIVPPKILKNEENSNTKVNEPVSSTPKQTRSTQSRLNQILSNEKNNEETNDNNLDQKYDYSSDDDTLSDNDSRFADVPGEGDEDEELEEDADGFEENFIKNNNQNNVIDRNNNKYHIYENNNLSNFYQNKDYYITEEDEDNEDDVNNLNVNDDFGKHNNNSNVNNNNNNYYEEYDVDEKFLINQEDEIDKVDVQNFLNNNNYNNDIKNEIKQSEENKKMDQLSSHTVIEIMNSKENIQNPDYINLNQNYPSNRIINNYNNNNNSNKNLIYSNFISSNPNTNLNNKNDNNQPNNRTKSINNYINFNHNNSPNNNNNKNNNDINFHHQIENEKIEIERRIEEFSEEYEITNRQEKILNKHRIYSLVNNERILNKYENNSIVK